jgi:uncharacterized membrane protein YfcA
MIEFASILYVLLGIASGFISGLIGSGAGVLIVPVMTIFGQNQIAGPASAVAVAMCSVTAALQIRNRFRGADAVPAAPGLIMAGSAFLTAHLGVSMAELAPLFAIPLTLALFVFLNLDLTARVHRNMLGRRAIGDREPTEFFMRYVVFGALTGTFGGIVGSAGGLMLFPLLLAYCGMTTREAVYSCLLMMLGSSLSAVSAQLFFGLPDLSVGIPLGIGAIIGGYFGVMAIEKVSEDALRALARVMLFELGLFLLIISFLL